MKLNKILTALIGLTFLFAACENEGPQRDPSPVVDVKAVYFAVDDETGDEIDPSVGTENYVHNVTVCRAEEVGTLTLQLDVIENTDSVFSLPESITFAEGQISLTFQVTFPTAEDGKTYALTLKVNESQEDPYLDKKVYYKYSVTPIKWEPSAKPAIFVDGIVAVFYGECSGPWYVNYDVAQLGNITKYRFQNPYRSYPSNFDPDEEKGYPDENGIYDGFSANYPEDIDSDNDYPIVIAVDNNGNATFEATELGLDWSYGMFSVQMLADYYAGKEGGEPDYDEYGIGEVEDGIITFPAGSFLCFMADYGGNLGDIDWEIWLDADKYIEEHSHAAISDFEDGFNDAEFPWKEDAITYPTQVLLSEAFSRQWTQTLYQAEDIDTASGDDSQFKNLFYLDNLYEAGYGLAFYWNQEKGSISIPKNQPTGITFAGKQILMGPSSQETEVTSAVVSGTEVNIIKFGLQLTTPDGGLIGEYTEQYIYGDPISWSIEAFTGNFVLTGQSIFGEDPCAFDVTIEQGSEANSLIITGVDFAEEIEATFDAVSSTMTIAPQKLPDYGTYDVFFYTLDDEYVSDSLVLVFQANIDGTISFSDDTESDGYALGSTAAGGLVDGYYDLLFTPSAPVEESAAKAAIRRMGAIKQHKTVKCSTAGFRIQGTAPRHTLHGQATFAL